MMKTGSGVLLLAASLAFLAACNNESPQSEIQAENMPQKTPGEWVMLFNGHDLSGWRSYNAAEPNPAWIVEDGAIVLDADDSTTEMTGGDLITTGEYENFELELEWKISEGGNSGIFYRVKEFPEQDVAYMTGIEMQILDDDVHPDGKNPKTSAGACYGLYPPTRHVARPVGEYNQVRLVVDDNHVQHWLNGELIVEYVIGSDDWNERVANSKFAEWEHYAESREGHIALQDHTDRVWFRNIRIREL